MKICSHCRKIFPRDTDHFYKNRSNTDGLGSYCRGCQKRNTNLKRRTDPEYQRRQTEATARYQKRKTFEQHARKLSQKAIRDGTLVPQPCEACGSEDRVEGHHDDYTQPLAVRWLCYLCHAEHHRLARDEEQASDQWCDLCHHWHQGPCTKNSLRWRNKARKVHGRQLDFTWVINPGSTPCLEQK